MATIKPRLDRRIVRSRNAILSAFERLLMDKPLADITVSAIAREANVVRSSCCRAFLCRMGDNPLT